jgi:hypothetical protein
VVIDKLKQSICRPHNGGLVLTRHIIFCFVWIFLNKKALTELEETPFNLFRYPAWNVLGRWCLGVPGLDILLVP